MTELDNALIWCNVVCAYLRFPIEKKKPVVMTLEDYLKEKYPDLKPSARDAAFARKVETSRQSIARYRLFQHFPTPVVIARIERASGGLVEANDHMPPELRARKKRARG